MGLLHVYVSLGQKHRQLLLWPVFSRMQREWKIEVVCPLEQSPGLLTIQYYDKDYFLLVIKLGRFACRPL